MTASSQRQISAGRLRLLMVGVTVAAILVLMLGAEGAVRLRQYLKYGSVATLEQQYTVDPKLKLRVPVAGFSSPRLSINSLGFRGGEIAVPKPASTIRVAFLGASTTYCAEVSGNDKVWTRLVVAELGRAFPGTVFDEVNAGVPGYTIESIQKNLEFRVAPLQPDVIVIYEASNNLSGEMRALARRQGIIGDEQIDVTSFPSRYSLLWYLVEKNLRVMTAQQAVRTQTRALDFDPQEIGAGYEAALVRLVKTAQAQARVVAIATFSIQPRRDQNPERQLAASASALFYMPFLRPQDIIAAFDRYNDIVREVARETGAILIEGENEIPGDPEHFNDSVHFTDAGSHLMAARISRGLVGSAQLRQLVMH